MTRVRDDQVGRSRVDLEESCLVPVANEGVVTGGGDERRRLDGHGVRVGVERRVRHDARDSVGVEPSQRLCDRLQEPLRCRRCLNHEVAGELVQQVRLDPIRRVTAGPDGVMRLTVHGRGHQRADQRQPGNGCVMARCEAACEMPAEGMADEQEGCVGELDVEELVEEVDDIV